MSTLASVILKGTASAMPTASIPGRVYFTTDTEQIFRDNGTSWDNVTPSGSVALITAIQQQSYVYAADTGAANALVVSLSPAPTITAGSLLVVKVAHANTGASTIAVNGGAAVAITKNGTTALAGGEMDANQIVFFIYDGTEYQLLGAATSTAAPGFGVPITLPAANGGSTYTLPSAPTTPTASMYFVRGLKWKYGATSPGQYTISGTTLTIVDTAMAAQTGDTHELYAY